MTEAQAKALVAGDDKEFSRLIEVELPSGETIRVAISSQMFAPLVETMQAFLFRSLAISQRMGGTPILEATRIAQSHRGNESALLLASEALGMVGFRLTPTQWVEVARLAQEAMERSGGVH